MDYDTEIKNLRNSMLELKIKIMMLSSKKDISDFAEQVKNYTKEYNELKRKYNIAYEITPRWLMLSKDGKVNIIE